MIPVVKALRSSGANVVLFANGRAVEILGNAGEIFLSVTSVEAMLQIGSPDVLVTSMCSQGGVGRDIVPRLPEYTKVVALQDYWGGYLWDNSAWQDRQFRPTFIIVNDSIGAELVVRAWPDFNPNNILKTGFPALDRYVTYDVAADAKLVRAALNVGENSRIVMYGGQWQKSAEMLGEIVRALNEISDNSVYLIPRAHPSMAQNAPEEVPQWEKAIGSLLGGTLLDGSSFTTQQLLAASDVVLSMFSTILVESATIRKQTISVLYPDVGLFMFRQSTGNSMDVPPVVSLGCSALAGSYEELLSYMRVALTDDLGLSPAQESNFCLDGQNAGRAAQFILSLI
jgi:hypothetical protein